MEIGVGKSSVLVCAGLSGFEETSAVSRLVPPKANGVLVIGHHSVFEGGDPFLQRTQGLEERASIVAEDGGPETGVGSRDAGAVAVCPGCQGQPFGGHGRREGRGHGVWEMARVGQYLVMLDRAHLEHATPQSTPEVAGSLQTSRRRPRGGCQHTDAVVQEPCAGMGRPRAFGTGDRMRSDEDVGRGKVRFDRLDDLTLGAAGVGHKGPCRYGLGGPAHVVRYPADRGTDHHDLGLGNTFFQVGRGLVDNPSILRLLECLQIAAHADDSRGQTARTKRQPDRAPDQPHAHDRHRFQALQDGSLSTESSFSITTQTFMDILSYKSPAAKTRPNI